MIDLTYIESLLSTQVIYLILTLAVTYLVVKGLHFAVNKISETAGESKRIKMTAKQTKHYSKPAKIAINLVAIIFVILMLLKLLGLQTSFLAVLSAAGFLGIVVGFAAKDVLSNLIAGFLIFLDQPFIIGDWISVGEVQGIVVDMKITSTRIKTFGGEMVSIPNSMVESEKIINKTHEGKLRVKADVSIDYGSDTEKAIKIAKEFMIKSKVFMENPEPSVYLEELGESGIKLVLRGWVNPNQQSAIEAKHKLLISVKKLYKQNGIKIPYPQVEVSRRK